MDGPSQGFSEELATSKKEEQFNTQKSLNFKKHGTNQMKILQNLEGSEEDLLNMIDGVDPQLFE